MSIDDTLPDNIKLELYKLKCELQSGYLEEMKQREQYYQSQNQYLTETINAKLNGVNCSTLYVCSNDLSILNLHPKNIEDIIDEMTELDLKGGFDSVCHFIFKNIIEVVEGYAKRMIVVNKNGTVKYLVDGKIYSDVRLAHFTNIIYNPIMDKAKLIFDDCIECPLVLNTYMKLKGMKLNNSKFRKKLCSYIQDQQE